MAQGAKAPEPIFWITQCNDNSEVAVVVCDGKLFLVMILLVTTVCCS